MKNLAKRIPWWLVVLAVGVAFIAIGAMQGGFADTLRKAALICYECIGIG
ncbi:CD1871A family CXXC motif-containing protein [Raoultibacter phocaeensis]|nr:CD1871A family CXXC motif-containing protein [Raoultibacter phocaeensis]